ncbi:MAG: RNA repair transcriptional activator RtcR family protein, partial [Myxococcota bacterium]
MRLVEQPESRGLYDRALVLATVAGQELVQTLVADLREHIPSVDLLVVELRDPTDYAEIFRALEPVVERIDATAPVDIVLSAGTPQMQTIWFILVKAGLLSGRMLQVIPAAFVPSAHPRAIRAVEL